jgi:hypothetical protein
MAPLWLSILGWAAIAAAAVSAGWIGFDMVVRRRRQHMRIMEVVWPVTALYFGPLGIWGYRRFGLPDDIGPDVVLLLFPGLVALCSVLAVGLVPRKMVGCALTSLPGQRPLAHHKKRRGQPTDTKSSSTTHASIGSDRSGRARNRIGVNLAATSACNLGKRTRRRPLTIEISLISAVHTHALCTRTQRHLAGPPQLAHRREPAAQRPHCTAHTLHTHA